MARAMKSHVERRSRNPESARNLFRRRTLEIHATDHVGVGRTELAEEADAARAGACLPLDSFGDGVVRRYIPRGLRRARAVKVGDRPANDAPEPRTNARRIFEGRRALRGLHHRQLDDVVRVRLVRQAPPRDAHEVSAFAGKEPKEGGRVHSRYFFASAGWPQRHDAPHKQGEQGHASPHGQPSVRGWDFWASGFLVSDFMTHSPWAAHRRPSPVRTSTGREVLQSIVRPAAVPVTGNAAPRRIEQGGREIGR